MSVILNMARVLPVFNILSLEQQITASFDVWLRMDEEDTSITPNRLYSGYGTLGPELITNGSFTAWTGATPNEVPDNMAVFGNDASNYVTQSTSGQCEFIAPTTALELQRDPYAFLDIGSTYVTGLQMTARTSGGVRVRGQTGGTIITTEATPTTYSVRHIADDTRMRILRSGNPTQITIDNWTVRQAGEADALNVGATLTTVETFNGYNYYTFTTNDYLQLSATWWNSRFDPEDFSAMIAINLSEADWESADVMTFWCMGADANNLCTLRKSADNTLTFTQTLGGASVSVSHTVQSNAYDRWIIPIVSVTASQVALYVDDEVYTTTPSAGTYAGNLAAAFCRIGSVNGGEFAEMSASNWAMTYA